jgi:2Fe-2S ferredoxin
MPKIIVLPSREHSPEGVTFEAEPGESIIEVLLKNNISIEHACDMQCACTTCHVYVRKGKESLKPAEEKEEDMLDKAWGLDMDSRLSCQARVKDKDIVIEIPKYTLNQISEGK